MNHLVLLFLLDDNFKIVVFFVTQKILIHNYLFVLLSLFSFQGAFLYFVRISYFYIKNGGLKWTRTTDLTLIRRAL